LFYDIEFHHSLKLTLVTSTITTFIALLLGIPTAYVLSRCYFLGKTLFEILLTLPIALPASQLGLSLLVAFDTPLGRLIQEKIGITLVYSSKGIIVAQLILSLCFGIKVWKNAFDNVDRRCEYVSRTLGASLWRTFFSITLPLARSGIITGIILAWSRAVGEYGAVLVFCGAFRGKTDILPISVFLNVSEGNIEKAIAICFIIAFTSMISIITIRKLGGKLTVW
jgi:molybdate transport system permease protein